jgi:hypothetical protein
MMLTGVMDLRKVPPETLYRPASPH